jgi:SHS2 domain-containing protein
MTDEQQHFSHYAFLEHEADMGVRGTGDCWACAFAAGATALLEIMADPGAVECREEHRIKVRGHDMGALFVSWLNEILYLRDAEEMLFSSFDIHIQREADGLYTLDATAWGEGLSADRHGLKTEVKAATFSGLKWGDEDGRRFVQCLLDL